MKLEYTVVYENSSDELDIEHHQIKVKVTVGLQNFFPLTTIQTVRFYNSTLVQARKLILSMYVHLIIICTIFLNNVTLELFYEFLESINS